MDDFTGMTPLENTSSGPTQNTTCGSVVESDLPLLILVYSLLFLVGLILNSFTLWFHCCGAHGQVSKSWMIYLKHLTAADFLLCVGLLLRIIYYSSSSFSIHLLYCSFGSPILFLNMTASILFMGYIAANRYMKIVYSSGNHFLMTAKASHIISMTTWFVLLTMVTPYSILMLTDYTPHRDQGTCYHLLNEQIRPMYKVIHGFAAIIFLSVLFSMVFFYYSASRRVLQIQQKQLGSSNSKKLSKSRRNMLVLVSVFCFCFVPYHIVRLPYVILREQCLVVLYYLKEVTVFMSFLNICLDPVIYVFLCKDFRAQLILKKRIRTKGNTSRSEVKDSEDELNTISTSRELLG